MHVIDDPLVSIGAYCLMSNHFHILLTPLVDSGVSMFMRKIMTGYSMYFNNRYDRTGTLFEGKFKAKIVDEDAYIRYLYAYIHLNPVKLIQQDWKERGITDQEKAKRYIRTYPYSSYQDYAGAYRNESKIIDKNPFPLYFASSDEFEANMFDWLEVKQS